MVWKTLTPGRILLLQFIFQTIIIGIIFGGIQIYYSNQNLQISRELANVTKKLDELQINAKICDNSKSIYQTLRNRIADCGKLNTLNKTEIKELNSDLNSVTEAQSLLELDNCSEAKKILDNIIIPPKCYQQQTNLPSICGNGKCEPSENSTTCPQDCYTTTTIPITYPKMQTTIPMLIVLVLAIGVVTYMYGSRKIRGKRAKANQLPSLSAIITKEVVET